MHDVLRECYIISIGQFWEKDKLPLGGRADLGLCGVCKTTEMPQRGLEPPRPKAQALNLLRMPIPPLGHYWLDYTRSRQVVKLHLPRLPGRLQYRYENTASSHLSKP